MTLKEIEKKVNHFEGKTLNVHSTKEIKKNIRNIK